MKKSNKVLVIFVAIIVMFVALSVQAEAAAIKLNQTKATIYVGSSTILKIKGTSDSVKWTSDDKKIATVDSKGKVTAKKAGTTTIKASIGKKSYKCKVTVKNPYLNSTMKTLNKGKTYTLKITGTTAKSWTSSDKEIATVDSKGKVTAKKTGTATITCKGKNRKSYKCTVIVKDSKSKDVAKLNDGNYGVFLGIDGENLSDSKAKIAGYNTIVIDAQEFSEKQIRKWKSEGHTVYSYLDVGSIETYRSYYKRFKHIALKAYDNWPDEYWVDVSDDSWQEFIIELGKSLTEKGVDGLFLDNTDVYYHYPTKEIYNGLENILSGLRQYTDKIVINGGDMFVEELMKEGDTNLLSGVNQEGVFSQIIDYEHDVFKKQNDEDTKYYQNYLRKCKKAGLDVYVLEYTKNYDIGMRAKKYCDKNGYELYISKRVNLD